MHQNDHLDRLDRKILYHLDVNARIPTQQLSKKIGASREVVDYRIKRLLRQGVIIRFTTHIQSEVYGFTSYKVYFKTKGLSVEHEKELVDYFLQHENVYWMASCDGVYDLIIAILAKDVYQLDVILQKCYRKYDAHFLSKDVTISTNIAIFRKEYLIGKKQADVPPLRLGGKKGTRIVDDKEEELLKICANNARMPLIEMGKKLGMSGNSVVHRIKKLEREGVISGYRCSVNLKKIGYLFCKVFLSLHFSNEQKIKELQQFCTQHPNITLYLICIGQWDFEIEMELENTTLFHELVKEIKTRFSDIIKDCESAIISKEYKFDYFPGCYPSEL